MITKPKAYRRPGLLPYKQFPRPQIAAWLREYRRDGKATRYTSPDGSRAYQFADKFNPYTIAIRP